MKLPFKEPLSSRYVYISPNNVVHLFMPVVSGTSVGLDNTCKSVYALQECFGKGGAMTNPHTLKKVLLEYRDALQGDLSFAGIDKTIEEQKRSRLEQIETYLKILTSIEPSKELNTLNTGFPSYPRPLEGMLQDKSRSNLHSIILRPTAQDAFIRSEASIPLFSVAHDSESRQRWHTTSRLQQALMGTYSRLTFQAQNVTSQINERVLARLKSLIKPDFKILQTILHEETKALTGMAIDFNQDAKGNPLTQEYITQQMMFDEQATLEDYIRPLLYYCTQELLETHVESPFNYLTTAEQWSIATQFLLGITSLYAVSQAKMSSSLNWGMLLDADSALSRSLAETMAQAQHNKQSPEEHLVNWINAQYRDFGLNAPLSPEDLQGIKQDFAARYVQIKDSPHFDEFFLLDTKKKGTFVVHQGSMCASFADFAASPMFHIPEHASFLERVGSDLKTLDGVEIPHQNPWVQASVDLDLSGMDHDALQSLYEQINIYKDSEVKKALLKQLAEERPDFKPKIDAKAFLQHVAYGEQDKAQALLEKDLNLAQELLLVQNIPFTDYSGRTFTCSAYEYAYWAKDTHMCRMLEKFMEEHTKVEILKRVKLMEEPIPGPELFPKGPRGLTYTQKGTENHSAHFDLTPLKQALKTYIDAYDNSPKATDADWEALDVLWRRVGLPQREVPAHIAHEYCHPRRSFDDVAKNQALLDASNKANLERQLKFYNYNTGSYDAWFTPTSSCQDSGLGFSFAILRGGGEGCRGRGGVCAVAPWRDLSAIEAIDKVRTEDLTRSLEHLAAPPSLQAPSVHSS